MGERVTLLVGPPGTGKTTTLLNTVEEALEAGIPPTRIAYLAFTRKAAKEAVTRACARFGMTPEDFPYFRTLHSLAFQELGLKATQVMQDDNWKELGAALGPYSFQDSYDERVERCRYGGGLGDMCLSAYSLGRATGMTAEEVWDRLNRENHGRSGVGDLRLLRKFIKGLEAYKRDLGLYDFTDFLDKYDTPLDVDLFILDEAQDLTQQQWQMARIAARNAPKVLIAGDDDQAIFQWAGADLRTLLSLKGALKVLPKSHRLPSSIYSLCQTITGKIKRRYPKSWTGRDDIGIITNIPHLEFLDVQEGEWMLMARHQFQMTWLEKFCRESGVVYQKDGVWSNQHPSIRAVLAYETMRKGQKVGYEQARLAARYARTAPLIPNQDEVGYEDIVWPFEGQPPWMEALSRLGDRQIEYIRRLRRSGESLVSPGRVTLSTIHASKGGEADNVVLLTDMSGRTKRNQLRDPDQENRVWYVGASRARKTLTLVAPRQQPSYKF